MTELEIRMTIIQIELNDALHRIAEGENEEIDLILVEQVRKRFPGMFNFGIVDVFNTFFTPHESKQQCERLASRFPEELKIYKKNFLRRDDKSPSALTILASIP